MADINRFGLSRMIPAAIKREVRQRSKFGCVMCRSAIFQYEHITPDFADAERHDPDGICLLCASCHDRVTRGRIGKGHILSRYRQIQVDANVKAPFEELALTEQSLVIRVGSAVFHNAGTLIRVNGKSLLSISPSESTSGLPAVSGSFFDAEGRLILELVDNFWSASIEAWDISVEGNRLVIRTAPGRIALELIILPPETVWVSRLNMFYEGCHIFADQKEVLIGYRIDREQYHYFCLENFQCSGARIGLDLDLNSVQQAPVRSLSMIGGEGIYFSGAGLAAGVGAGQMYIEKLRFWDSGIKESLGRDR